MMEQRVILRSATPEDAKTLREIYAPYVEQTAVSMEWEVPTEEEFRGRMEQVLKEYPYLVAEEDGEILGYAYASRFHPRAGFLYSAEISIYLRETCRRGGLGRRLYTEMERLLAAQGIKNLYASIATTTRAEDPNLTADSPLFHGKMGYRTVAVFHDCCCKFGRWYDLTWMEKFIGEHP